jgi:hypothetical protein
MEVDEPLTDRYEAARTLIDGVLDQQQTPTFARILDVNTTVRRATTLAMLADEPTVQGVQMLGKRLYAGYTLDQGQMVDFSHSTGYWDRIPAPVFPFCIPMNQVVYSLRRHAEFNLRKIRACRNIAGLELRLDPYALPSLAKAATDENGLPMPDGGALQPLPYRYTTLIERAKQLVDLARQIETSMLSFIESADRARYDEIKARQDMALTMAGVRLRDLHLSEALNGVELAVLQREQASAQSLHYRGLLAIGISSLEQAGLAAQATAIALQASGMYSAEGFIEGAGAAAPVAAQTAQLLSTFANYERREQDWRFQIAISEREEVMSQQRIRLAQDGAAIATQERAVAAMQAEYAEENLNFLTTKRFGTSVLYEWMSGVLDEVYRFFLQQATTMAKLAQAQLAFERQEIPPAFIKADYWEPPSRDLTPDLTLPALVVDGQGPNLRGLTGSARLLRDMYELDQYAFRTNQRKLQLTETISLAQLDPFVFQRFRETGMLPFATPMTLFDQKFPGHYLRLIRRVRTTVIALIPPVDGIRATLATTGVSRVVIGPDEFQTVALQRGSESVGLTSPTNATGLFELDVQPELLIPFEGIGVDTTWEFTLPKPANRFDYNTIADVLVTIDYTALDSPDYRQQVLEEASGTVSGDRAFSFRHHFPDAWWDLHNPDQTPDPLRVSVTIDGSDFPANLEDNSLAIQEVRLYFSFKPNHYVQLQPISFSYTTMYQGTVQALPSYSAAPINGVITSRQGNWPDISNKSVVGTWEFSFRETAAAEQTARAMFASKDLNDILLVITYEGEIPAWPNV